jgi:glutaredoxin-related protein
MKNIIWTKENCSYCTKAKELLLSKDINFEERNISKEWTKEQLLESVPEAKTVPQIFLWGKYVGGYDSLLQYIEDHNM